MLLAISLLFAVLNATLKGFYIKIQKGEYLKCLYFTVRLKTVNEKEVESLESLLKRAICCPCRHPDRTEGLWPESFHGGIIKGL